MKIFNNQKSSKTLLLVFECENIRIFKALLHISWNLFLGTKKDTTKVKTKAGRYAWHIRKKMSNLSLNMLINVMLIKKHVIVEEEEALTC